MPLQSESKCRRRGQEEQRRRRGRNGRWNRSQWQPKTSAGHHRGSETMREAGVRSVTRQLLRPTSSEDSPDNTRTTAACCCRRRRTRQQSPCQASSEAGEGEENQTFFWVHGRRRPTAIRGVSATGGCHAGHTSICRKKATLAARVAALRSRWDCAPQRPRRHIPAGAGADSSPCCAPAATPPFAGKRTVFEASEEPAPGPAEA